MVERVLPEEAYEGTKEGGVLLLDVRRHSWEESDVKAKGALRADPDNIEQYLNEIPKGKQIVAYCT